MLINSRWKNLRQNIYIWICIKEAVRREHKWEHPIKNILKD